MVVTEVVYQPFTVDYKLLILNLFCR